MLPSAFADWPEPAKAEAIERACIVAEAEHVEGIGEEWSTVKGIAVTMVRKRWVDERWAAFFERGRG